LELSSQVRLHWAGLPPWGGSERKMSLDQHGGTDADEEALT
jgi:hypothetical protein